MSEERSDRQAAHNETVFRDADEQLLARAREPRSERFQIGVKEYEAIRKSTRCFVVLPGHQLDGAGIVRERGCGYVVVEKTESK